MKNSFLGILVLSHVISISIVIGSEEESNDNGKFHEEAEFGIYYLNNEFFTKFHLLRCFILTFCKVEKSKV